MTSFLHCWLSFTLVVGLVLTGDEEPCRTVHEGRDQVQVDEGNELPSLVGGELARAV